MRSKIIVFGGTFNPIHNAHLRIARFIRNKFKPDKIIFIPCNIPYHKGHKELINGKHRLEMTRLAIQDKPGFEISDMEIRRGGKTFSIQTLKTLKRQSRSRFSGTVTQFYFIIGSDSLVDLPRWYEIDKLIRLCKFITVSRPGYDFNKLIKSLLFSDDILKNMKQLYQSNLRIDISSSQIRENIKKGKPIKSLVPRTVESYIKKYGLYK